MNWGEVVGAFLEKGILGAIIIVLGVVVWYLYGELKAERAINNSLREKQLADAIAARDKITVPLEEQRKLSQKIYDGLELFFSNRIDRGK